MYLEIGIELDELIDMIMSPHTEQETADIIEEYCDLDLSELDERDTSNSPIIAKVVLKNNSINKIISDCTNTDITIDIVFDYLKNNTADTIEQDNIGTILDILVDDGYIKDTGLRSIKNSEPIKYFSEASEFIWSEETFNTISNYADTIKSLVIAYIKDIDYIQHCDERKEWTDEPYDYIIDYWFSDYDGAKEKWCLDFLFEHFNTFKHEYIKYFGKIMNLTTATTIDEFKQMCFDAPYTEFYGAYKELLEESSIIDDTNVFANYFD